MGTFAKGVIMFWVFVGMITAGVMGRELISKPMQSVEEIKYVPDWAWNEIDDTVYATEIVEEEATLVTSSSIRTYSAPNVISVEAKLNQHLDGALKNTGDSFVRYGEIYDIDPFLLASISIWETGNGTSKAVKQLKNAGGIMANAYKGTLKSFISVNSSIEYMANLLRGSYLDGRNVHSIQAIGNIYCPIGVNNDPNGLNNYWVGGVTKTYNNICGSEYLGGN